MTIAALIYGFIPPFADFNQTHVFNPLWTRHAKFHVVWQVIITFALAVLGITLVWVKKVEKEFSITISFLLGLIVLGGFMINASVTSLYGGGLSDPNGVPRIFNNLVDANLFTFLVGLVCLLAGYFMYRAKGE